MSSFNVTIVKGDPLPKEAAATEAITPGHLVELISTGLRKHATSGGNAIPRFAVENSDIGDTVDTAYASGDQAKYIVARPGDEIQARVAASQTLVVGDALVSNGDGTLKKYTAEVENNRIDMDATGTTVSFTNTIYDTTIVAYALEAVTSSTAGDKILVEAA